MKETTMMKKNFTVTFTDENGNVAKLDKKVNLVDAVSTAQWVSYNGTGTIFYNNKKVIEFKNGKRTLDKIYG